MTSKNGGENPYASPTVSSPRGPVDFSRLENDQWYVQYEMTPDDLKAFTLHHYFKTPLLRQAYLRHWFTVTALLIGLGIMLLLETWSNPPVLGTMIIVAGVFYGAYYPWAYRRRVRRMTEYMLSGGRNVGLLGLHEVEESERGLLHRTAAAESLYFWHALERAELATDHCLIYVTSVSAIVVPARAFADRDGFESFQSGIQERISKALTA